MDYTPLIIQTANQYGVPPSIALAVATKESGLQHYTPGGNVIQGDGGAAVGLFQLHIAAANDVGVGDAGRYDPLTNIQGGVQYLRRMYQLTGSWEGALEAYNGGIGNWQAGSVSTAAQGYAKSVLSRAQTYGTVPSGGSGPTTPLTPAPGYSSGSGGSQVVYVPNPPDIGPQGGGLNFDFLSNLLSPYPTVPTPYGTTATQTQQAQAGQPTDALDGVAAIGTVALILVAAIVLA